MEENAQRLAALLNGRDGWRVETDDDGDHWCFGVDGAARLVITPEMDGFLMYRADQDTSWVIPRIGQVREWLDANKQDHAGLTPLQQQLKRALGQPDSPAGGSPTAEG